MKKCKIITINDGREETLTNGNFLAIYENVVTERELEKLINDGWEVKAINPCYRPAIQKQGVFSFYIGGVQVYLEKEVEGEYIFPDEGPCYDGTENYLEEDDEYDDYDYKDEEEEEDDDDDNDDDDDDDIDFLNDFFFDFDEDDE